MYLGLRLSVVVPSSSTPPPLNPQVYKSPFDVIAALLPYPRLTCFTPPAEAKNSSRFISSSSAETGTAENPVTAMATAAARETALLKNFPFIFHSPYHKIMFKICPLANFSNNLYYSALFYICQQIFLILLSFSSCRRVKLLYPHKDNESGKAFSKDIRAYPLCGECTCAGTQCSRYYRREKLF